MSGIEAVVFDLDGVLVQSEEVWDDVRRALAAEHDVPWPPDATTAMMGMSSIEWSRHMQREIGVPLEAEEISRDVVRRLEERYRESPPWIDGALDAVERIGARWPLGLATSSNREIIDLVLERGGLGERFRVTVSSEEVGAGKPAPDVYLEAASRLGAEAGRCAAIEDSTNGLLSARAAGMRVIAIPNPAHPPEARGLAAADVVLDSIRDLTAHAVSGQ
jgi:HAD superfamily hydrolase (TIGR01509 family)